MDEFEMSQGSTDVIHARIATRGEPIPMMIVVRDGRAVSAIETYLA